MKNILLESIGYVGAEFLDKAENYTPKKKNKRVKWGAIAACLCLLLSGLLPPGNKTDSDSPADRGFVFTAYALGADSKVISAEMSEGESVPVSFFESEKGIKGFFFSFPFAENEQGGVPSRLIIDQGQHENCTADDVIKIIAAKCMDAGRNYVYFVVGADTEMPCSFPYVCTTADPDVIYQMDLMIDEADGGYTATLVKMTEIKRVYDRP